MTNLKQDAPKDEDPTRKVAALRLLQAVLKQDDSMIDLLLEDAGVNPNCTFNGLPLMSIAAWHKIPLRIIQKLETYGGDPNLSNPANGLYPHDLAHDSGTKDFLLTRHKRFKDDPEIIAKKPEPDHFTVTKFKNETHFIQLDIIGPSWADPKHHVIGAQIHPDTILDLLDNVQEIIADQKKDESTIKEIITGFESQGKLILN